jgi:hypothetical protein
MANPQTKVFETSTAQPKLDSRRRWPMIVSGIAIIATAFVIIWFTKLTTVSSSRNSTPAEIAAQEAFQGKWNAEHEEIQLIENTKQKLDSIEK